MLKKLIATAAEQVAVEEHRRGNLDAARAAMQLARAAGGVAPPVSAHADAYGTLHFGSTPSEARSRAVEAGRTY